MVIIGAGIGGLASAALLAARGYPVTVIEKEAWAGGKARSVRVQGSRIDGGPTVFTLRDVFDGIFRSCGAELDSFVTMRRAQVLARHAWDDKATLDLHADPARSEEAIREFAGTASAEGYRKFREESRKIYNSLNDTMMRAPKPATPFSLIWRMGLSNIGDFAGKHPYVSLWKALGDFFPDQRLRQLFARYSTYCGSSPFDAPATLMLVAHVEAMGVWLIDGGIAALADALKRLGEANGAQYRFGQSVEQIETAGGKASGVVLSEGERIAADAVICNADPSAIGNGFFGAQASKAVSATTPANRSLSAFVWYANARTSGFPLQRHNVFFSSDYIREFRDIASGDPPADPTVYVCAQDRDALAEPGRASPPEDRERLQIIVNAPANGDTHTYSAEEIDRCTLAMRASLSRCGLDLEDPLPHQLATPNEFERLWPSTGGALYGRATRGWAASFLRQGSKTKIPGLYCAGGSTHPGAGVPMAALSGQLAANTVMQDLASTRKLHPVVMAGGTSTRSAQTGDMA
ncbi:1-hydroxycarotenoid 3,4-desaturase CrtD [Altererythrobacter sp.]|uniref:1-hydroxycarotenoid 3,4-desaturase CrtD n=1 Tax=Altererythrobacter sp. TaxID=1872480 RepID=UPI00338EBAA9